MINRFTIISFIKKNEIIFISGVVLITLVAGTLIFLIPNIYRAKSIYEEKNQLQKRYEKLKQKDNVLTDLDSKLYQGILSKLYQILPDNKDYVSLFEAIDDLEKNSKVKILSLDFPLGSLSEGSGKLKTVTGTSVYYLPVTIGLEGDFVSIEKCLDQLSDLSGRIFTLSSVSVQRKQENLFKLTLTGNTYLVSQPTVIGSLDSPLPKISNIQLELLDKIAKQKTDISQVAVPEKISVGKKNLFD